ncbi:DUF6933 domain-containing protein [Pokkaliibacter sp. CJK22405]|uniref:DUF6933 domain-containing protein n=1 Tax=Pokkaliibacter sp. CJK22405 TaxID=3384615 RepID=UPI003984B476
MIQIYLSKALAGNMKPILSAELDIQPDGMHWYAHLVTLPQGRCVLAMEEYSRYVMLFTDVDFDDISHFPELFRERLWREVLAVCMLDDNSTKDVLGALVDQLSIQQVYRQGYDASVMAHLRDVSQHLEEETKKLGHLPRSQEDAFNFGLRVNDVERHRGGSSRGFRPLQLFSESWLGMLEFSYQQIKAHALSGSPDNVISLNSRRH